VVGNTRVTRDEYGRESHAVTMTTMTIMSLDSSIISSTSSISSIGGTGWISVVRTGVKIHFMEDVRRGGSGFAKG